MYVYACMSVSTDDGNDTAAPEEAFPWTLSSGLTFGESFKSQEKWTLNLNYIGTFISLIKLVFYISFYIDSLRFHLYVYEYVTVVMMMWFYEFANVYYI